MNTKVTSMLLLLVVVAVGMTSVEGRNLRKRFFFHEIKHAAESVVHTIADTASDAYDKAKDTVKSIASNFDFSDAVDALSSLVSSETSHAACIAACSAGATTVLGSDADEASLLCPPLCDAALDKLGK